ncbi:MAG: hypothetical protein ABW193_07920 [Luteibacter sp.]
MNIRLRPLAAILAGLACAGAQAAAFPVNHALPDARLDGIRGGFDLGDNLKASFALQRTVLVNGMEALHTTISVPDIANITHEQASALQSALQTTVVTNGAGGIAGQPTTVIPTAAAASTVLPGSAAPGLVIQNSLDNQAITANTTIDASVNTAQMLQNMRVAESVKDAVIQFRGN